MFRGLCHRFSVVPLPVRILMQHAKFSATTPLSAHIALLSVNIIYGINFVVAKEVMPAYIGPLGFIVIRAGVAMLLFWIAAAWWRSYHSHSAPPTFSRREWATLLLGGLTGVAANQTLFFKGLSLTSPIHGALIMITTPILVLLLSVGLIGSERLTWRKSAGVLLGLSDAAMVILSSTRHTSDGSSALGDFCIFLNALSYGFYLVIIKPLLMRYHFLDITKWTFLVGFLLVLPLGGREFWAIEWHSFTPYVWACVAYVVILVTFMAYLLSVFALRHADASLVSSYIYTQPLITSIIALSLGKDQLQPITLIAAALIFVGVYWVSASQK